MKNWLRLKQKSKLHRMKLEKLKKLLKNQRLKEREYLTKKLPLKKKFKGKKPQLHWQNKKLKKLPRIWKRHKRRLLIGRNKPKRPKRKPLKKWPKLKQLNRREKLSLRLKEKKMKLNMLLLLRNKKQNTQNYRMPLRKPTNKQKKQEKPRKPNKLLLTRRLWLIEKPNSRRNSETCGQQALLVSPTSK